MKRFSTATALCSLVLASTIPLTNNNTAYAVEPTNIVQEKSQEPPIEPTDPVTPTTGELTPEQLDEYLEALEKSQTQGSNDENTPKTFAGEVTVEGNIEKTNEQTLLDARKNSAIVSDSISSEEISKSPDSNAADTVQRLTGITILGDKYVFVRGLGERYSGSTINGSILPSTETERRVVPLNLFPSKLLERIDIIKTYTPDMQGDFGSGIVQMKTKNFPKETLFSIGLGTGINSSATGQDFRTYAGGLDILGRGGQKLPSGIPTEYISRRTALNPVGYTPEEIQAFGRLMVGDWTGTETSAQPNTNFSLTYGDTIGRLGLIFSATSTSGYESIDEELRFFSLDSNTLVPRNNYELVTDKENAQLAGITSISFKLNDDHTLSFDSFYTKNSSTENRVQEGLSTNSGGFIKDYRVMFKDEQVLSTKLSGKHNFSWPGIASLLEWHGSKATATNNSDLRENLYSMGAQGVYSLMTGSPETGKMEFYDLEDNTQELGIDYTVFFSLPKNAYGSIKAGHLHMNRERGFEARRLRFVVQNQTLFDLTQMPEQLFTPENIRPGGFELRETTGVNDAYDATHTVTASYLMADINMNKWRVVGGARMEDSNQNVVTYNPFNTETGVISSEQSTDVLPSLNIIYRYSPNTNFRVAYSRSVNRPEFRELSPFTFVEVTGGRSIAGNPDLKQATIDAYDLRWETFPSQGSVIATSAFYKTIQTPIERIIQPTTELRTSFVNADQATLMGGEIELRHSLDVLGRVFKNWSVNANYTYTTSEVSIGDQQYSVTTTSNRPLMGQSDHVGNISLQYFNPRWGFMSRALITHVGERITDVGSFGLPDIKESPYTTFDIVISQDLAKIAKGLSMKIAGHNLLDTERIFTQGNEIQRIYSPGRAFSIGLSYTPPW